MGFYSSQREKKESIAKDIKLLQLKIEDIQAHAYNNDNHELQDLAKELYGIYDQISMGNSMGIMKMPHTLKNIPNNKRLIKELIKRGSENDVQFMKVHESDEHFDYEVEVEYEYPITRTMTNPFTLDEIILVFDLDENEQLVTNKIVLKNKHNLKDALDKGNKERKNNDISKEDEDGKNESI